MKTSRMPAGNLLKSHLFITILLFAIVSSTGCSSLVAKKYAEPRSGNTAKFKVTNKTPGVVAINLYEKADTCSERRTFKIVSDWIAISADKDFAFTLFLDTESYENRMTVIRLVGGPLGIWAASALSPDNSGPVTIKFTPKPNLYYSVEITEDNKNCSVKFSSSASLEGPYAEEPTAKLMKFHRAVSEEGSWCEPLGQDMKTR